MSGGKFDYRQHDIQKIIEDIEYQVAINGKEKDKSELQFYAKDYLEKWPEEKFHYKYPDDIIEEFKKGIHYLNIAYIYAQRIDWLLSGDDSEDSFRERLKEELTNLEAYENNNK